MMGWSLADVAVTYLPRRPDALGLPREGTGLP